MTITLIINGQGLDFANHKFRRSQYVNDILKDFGLKDVDIIVPEDYNNVINNYIDFLDRIKTPINDPKYLFTCFFVADYFMDISYFNYLIPHPLSLPLQLPLIYHSPP